ncbi:MAG: hypothetical protein M1814_000574 [Vezdaea aestivalis]|nr:MAG: hypothetical protein M1814_000574 [Vezdaea aestivalis]
MTSTSHQTSSTKQITIVKAGDSSHFQYVRPSSAINTSRAPQGAVTGSTRSNPFTSRQPLFPQAPAIARLSSGARSNFYELFRRPNVYLNGANETITLSQLYAPVKKVSVIDSSKYPNLFNPKIGTNIAKVATGLQEKGISSQGSPAFGIKSAEAFETIVADMTITTRDPTPTIYGHTQTRTLSTTVVANPGEVLFLSFPQPTTSEPTQYTTLPLPTNTAAKQFPNGQPILFLTQVEGIVFNDQGRAITTATIVQAPPAPYTPDPAGGKVALEDPSYEWKSWSPGEKAGVVIACVVAFVLISSLLIYLCAIRRQRNKKERGHETRRSSHERNDNRDVAKRSLGERMRDWLMARNGGVDSNRSTQGSDGFTVYANMPRHTSDGDRRIAWPHASSLEDSRTYESGPPGEQAVQADASDLRGGSYAVSSQAVAEPRTSHSPGQQRVDDIPGLPFSRLVGRTLVVHLEAGDMALSGHGCMVIVFDIQIGCTTGNSRSRGRSRGPRPPPISVQQPPDTQPQRLTETVGPSASKGTLAIHTPPWPVEVGPDSHSSRSYAYSIDSIGYHSQGPGFSSSLSTLPRAQPSAPPAPSAPPFTPSSSLNSSSFRRPPPSTLFPPMIRQVPSTISDRRRPRPTLTPPILPPHSTLTQQISQLNSPDNASLKLPSIDYSYSDGRASPYPLSRVGSSRVRDLDAISSWDTPSIISSFLQDGTVRFSDGLSVYPQGESSGIVGDHSEIISDFVFPERDTPGGRRFDGEAWSASGEESGRFERFEN